MNAGLLLAAVPVSAVAALLRAQRRALRAAADEAAVFAEPAPVPPDGGETADADETDLAPVIPIRRAA